MRRAGGNYQVFEFGCDVMAADGVGCREDAKSTTRGRRNKETVKVSWQVDRAQDARLIADNS